jgi:pantothenate kinase type III
MSKTILLLDIGNSAVKWRLQLMRGRLGDLGDLSTEGRRDYSRGFEAALRMQWRRLGRLCDDESGRVVFSNVAKTRYAEPVLGLATQCFPGSREALRASPRTDVGSGANPVAITCHYRRPSSLGADRWAAVLGLVAQGRRIRSLWGLGAGASKRVPLWVVSAGTATVVDLVWAQSDPQGRLARLEHHGGLIFPGMGLMRDSLSEATGSLRPYVEASVRARPFPGIPRQSHQAIARGIASAQMGGLLVLPLPRLVFVHGGFAADWRSCLEAVWSALPVGKATPGKVTPITGRMNKPPVVHAPGLILDGLAQWAKRRG